MNNCFIRTYDSEWAGPVENLKAQLGFDVVELHGKEFGNFPTKFMLLKKELHNTLNLLKNLGKYNHSNMIICSNYAALILLVLRKLHILKCNKILWFGVYIHRPKMLKLIRKLLKLIMPKDFPLRIVVFSKPEIPLYAEAFGLTTNHFIYVPYGEWNKNKIFLETGDEGYLFSGGYANRDFVTLAKLFQDKPWKLVIAASEKNEDFVKYVAETKISDNITIYWDIPTERFNELLRKAHAVIMIMKYNTGASGQIVILTALEYKKLVIASYTDVIDEYVKNDETGIVLYDKSPAALESVMEKVLAPENAGVYEKLAENGHEHYRKNYSYEAISAYLVNAIRKELNADEISDGKKRK